MKKLTLFTVLTLISVAAAGCGSQPPSSQPAAEAEAPKQPVTLKMYTNQSMTKDDLDKLINQPLQKKYPYITVEIIPTSNNSLTQQVASGEQLDLVTIYNGHIPTFKELNIFQDITPLTQKHKFDLGRFDPKSLDTLKAIADKGELYGLPYNLQLNALYYNKDIFDRFGVEYPKDGMTWDDAIELAKKLTRQVDGVQYRGLDPEGIIRLMYPLSLNIVDAKTNKPMVNSEPYKKLYEMGNRIYSIPGNKPPKGANANNAFMKDKQVAMYAVINLFDKLAQVPEFNWDIAQYPSYKENPNVYGMYDLHVMTISKTTKYPDEAMKVLEVLFSDEVQSLSVRSTGRVSPLKDPKFKNEFGADMPVLKGKNIKSIFKSSPASAPPFSIYYTKARDIFSGKFTEYLDGKKDVNTALREAEEQITQYIRENAK
ncbi:hypothetical protein PAESOLCIP111_02380 [Paenibacillus solanacearum]|uniref:Extracellular solute-binding protein n=1 Tax=Paenibacillus solanacearum TaxID=2048548 RepID=A0A916K0R6_9BACL|nr:extracellular solute-binding protein [Paenibacillus solanacearum]CAG7621985.1 hypothetical protein PAESOLCIP111_02380 [Paenibacillus solanacearum]